MHGEEITVVGKRLLTMITFAVPNELWIEDVQVRCVQGSVSRQRSTVSNQRSAASSSGAYSYLGGQQSAVSDQQCGPYLSSRRISTSLESTASLIRQRAAENRHSARTAKLTAPSSTVIH